MAYRVFSFHFPRYAFFYAETKRINKEKNMGVYEISDPEYRAMAGLSQSRCKRLLKSGLEYMEPHAGPSAAFRLGDAVDTMVLTPELTSERFVIAPDYANDAANKTAGGNRSTSSRTAYVKEKMAAFGREHVGKQFLSAAEFETAQRLSEMVRSKPFFKKFSGDKTAKTQLALDGDILGVRVKGLLDGVSSSMLFDLKTTMDSSIRAFRGSAFKFGYFFQLRWYAELCWQNGYDFPLDQCYIIAAGKQTPHDVTVFRVPVRWLDEAKDQIDYCIEKYRRMRKSGSEGFMVGQDDGASYMWLGESGNDVELQE